MQLIDTHAHLDSERFRSDLLELIARAQQAGVQQIIAIGTDAKDSRSVVNIAAKYPAVFAAVGIHPNDAAEADPDDWQSIVALATSPKVVALGETGLDKYWDRTPFAVQQDYFDRHLRLSQQMDLPVVIHTRECLEDAIVMLSEARRRGPIRGVMHSFTGDAAGAEQCVQLGLHISFAGMVTFKKSADLRAVAAAIPADRILIETDCPYLAPEPNRGKRNEPAWVIHTAHCLAEARQQSIEEFAQLTTENARTLFRLPAV
ncbi:MAG: TatD family hydrolase [Planctomycetota bacterium]|nr:TatD family hydrolase [Planctomycetota bacterium]